MDKFLYLLKASVSIPTIFFLLAGFGLWLTQRRRVAGLVTLGLLTTLLVLSSVPWVGAAGLRSLQTFPALEDPEALSGKADAIVVVSADAVRFAPELGGSTIGRLTLERVRYAARLGRMSGLPILTSGGSIHTEEGDSVAQLMSRVLEDEFDVRVRWVESRSRTTEENARFSADLLRADGIERVALVTHAWHMPRAHRAFERAGLNVVPAPTAFRPWPDASLRTLVPSARSLQETAWAWHEWVGRLWYALRGT